VGDRDAERLRVSPQAPRVVAVAEDNGGVYSGEMIEHRSASNITEVNDLRCATSTEEFHSAASARGVTVGVRKNAEARWHG
jgi:hypothetical protein